MKRPPSSIRLGFGSSRRHRSAILAALVRASLLLVSCTLYVVRMIMRRLAPLDAGRPLAARRLPPADGRALGACSRIEAS